MDNDRSSPPSDEIMGKVVAKTHKWESCKGPFWNGNHNAFQCQQEPYAIVPDPRESTDAALELLHWMEYRYHHLALNREWVREGYLIRFQYPRLIPISGQPFRTAVCWLAADVLGVTNA
jgi:hypothetical protein